MPITTNSRWRWPSFAVAAGLELLIVVTLLWALNGLALRTMADYVARAKLTETLVALHAARLDVVERLALSGDPIDLPGGEALARPIGVTELLGRSPQRGKDDAPKPRPASSVIQGATNAVLAAQGVLNGQGVDQQSARAGTGSRYVDDLRFEGSAIVARGHVGSGGQGGFDLALVPLMQDLPEGRVSPVIAWQCNHLAMPTGWTGPNVTLDQPAPPGWLPRLCRPDGVAP